MPQLDTPHERWSWIKTLLEHLKIGGLAVVVLLYRYTFGAVSASDAVDGADLTRNEIGKWVLRLIGEGFSVAPLAFLPYDEVILDKDGYANLASSCAGNKRIY
jgi:hypothetical protein